MKAFPNSHVMSLDTAGMDLRDYFAASAPVYFDEAFESLQMSTKTTFTEKYDREVVHELARLSYLYADAMMRAREK
jgi:hypothetical protein